MTVSVCALNLIDNELLVLDTCPLKEANSTLTYYVNYARSKDAEPLWRFWIEDADEG